MHLFGANFSFHYKNKTWLYLFTIWVKHYTNKSKATIWDQYSQYIFPPLSLSLTHSPVCSFLGQQLLELAQGDHSAFDRRPVWDWLAAEVVRYRHILTRRPLG